MSEKVSLRLNSNQPDSLRLATVLHARGVFAKLAGVLTPGVLALAVSAFGLFLRVEHAITFDGPKRGSDYRIYVEGVRWMLVHHRPFFFDYTVNYQVWYQPPLWFAASALILFLTDSERAIGTLAVMGWMTRQLILGKLLKEAIPQSKWSALLALSIHAVLPLSVLMDAKVNPEGMHSGLFMLALYFLWKMERQASDWAGIHWRTAVWFGLVAGLALLTKATASVLMVTAALVLGWRAAKMLSVAGWERGWTATWRRIVRPMAVATVVWCVVVGWWCGPNLRDHGHPFPHPWDLEGPADHAELAAPFLYRRPLGWALPAEWSDYLRFPIIGGPHTPYPNFWAYAVIGTWTDLYNRGFCRLRGGGTTDKVWGGDGGIMPSGPEFSVSGRCIDLFSKLAWIGLFISIAASFAVVRTGWMHVRAKHHQGSLVLSAAPMLVVLFVFLFALKYPFDEIAVLNPKYLLSATAPMAACFGMWLSHFRARSLGWKLAHGLSFGATGIVACLLLFERFGR